MSKTNHNQWLLEHKSDIIPLHKWQRTVNVMSKIFKAPAGFIVQHTDQGYQIVIASCQDSNPYHSSMWFSSAVSSYRYWSGN